MTTPKTGRRPPSYDGTWKRCGICDKDKRRTEANFGPSYGKKETADGLPVYCRTCHITLVGVRRRKQSLASGGRAALEKLRGEHLRSLAMLNVLLSGRANRAANADVARMTLAEVDRLLALPNITTPKPKES